MNNKYFDIVVAKNFETRQNGQVQVRKTWNKVGRAWNSKTPGTFSFELFLIPGEHYFIDTRDIPFQEPQDEETPL